MIYPWLEALSQQLFTQADQGKLHHALLMSGIAGLGKHDLAKELAQRLLCAQPHHYGSCGVCHSCQLFLAGNHPDFHQINETEKRLISIDTVRQLNKVVAERAQQGTAKVVVFDNAESFNESSANALLKTLEEPTDNSYFILLCESVGRLMPTITSRCQKILLHAPNDCLPWLTQQGYRDVPAGLIQLYQGAPLAVLQALKQQNATEYEQIAVEFDQFIQGKSSSFQLADFISQDLDTRMNWFYYLLHDMQKVQVGVAKDKLIFSNYHTLLVRCSQQWSAVTGYHLAEAWLKLKQQFISHSGLKKDLLLSQYFIDLKNKPGG
ncbi:DNA polymerase III subunit delta' [Motilimonas sp. 1_MG-2023]|uniref:DNA polymerase III subunit delta' n=1 Tax=Motilimonas sp. 1_MG-2023 TaxID=3062672 RepID=UPI0026E2DD7F|nr:DNA polymerase III subunit delta' [Motilimonas sp. 1_MG-2023]MDO6525524.1 DNA polymerase III subunit delta' [Motilimonas sp. 1_MG-2023]